MQDLMSLGQKIKTFRKRAGMSQFDLEVQLGASPGSLSRIENGEVNPTKETIIKIIEVLGLKTFEAGSLFNLDFEILPKMVELARKVNVSLDLTQVLQNSANEIALDLDLLGLIIFLVEDNKLVTKTITQTYYTNMLLEILNLKEFNLGISLEEYTENLIVKSVINQKVYLNDELRMFTKDIMPVEVSDLCGRVTNHKSSIVFPLINEGKSIGAILFYKNYIDNFKDDFQVLDVFSKSVTTAIINAQKYSKLEDEVKILKSGK